MPKFNIGEFILFDSNVLYIKEIADDEVYGVIAQNSDEYILLDGIAYLYVPEVDKTAEYATLEEIENFKIQIL